MLIENITTEFTDSNGTLRITANYYVSHPYDVKSVRQVERVTVAEFKPVGNDEFIKMPPLHADCYGFLIDKLQTWAQSLMDGELQKYRL